MSDYVAAKVTIINSVQEDPLDGSQLLPGSGRRLLTLVTSLKAYTSMNLEGMNSVHRN